MEAAIEILSTAPLSTALKQKALQQNIVVTDFSFISVQPVLSDQLNDEINGLTNQSISAVFTSTHGVNAVADILKTPPKDWNIYCIGHSTKAAVAAFFGEKAIVSTAQYGLDLAHNIIGIDREYPIEKLVFFAGNIRGNDLPDTLSQNHLKVSEYTVYETILNPQVFNKNFKGILFYSSSAVDSFFKVNTIIDNTVCFAIGTSTAATIKKYCGNKIVISDFTTKENVLGSAINYFK